MAQAGNGVLTKLSISYVTEDKSIGRDTRSSNSVVWQIQANHGHANHNVLMKLFLDYWHLHMTIDERTWAIYLYKNMPIKHACPIRASIGW